MPDIQKSPPPFKGVATALITPFSNGRIDLTAFKRIVKVQLAAGVNALIVAGTTGESFSLDEKERATLLDAALTEASGRVPVIMGTGAADTRIAVHHTRVAADLGADGVLAVTPYYVRGTQDGLVSHYLQIADAADLPVILYNVPSRTGVDLTPALLTRLAEHPRIVAIKEASGKIDRVADIRAALGDRMPIYCGNDGDLLPTLSLGGIGVISVLSNLLPGACVTLYQDFVAGEVQKAAAEAIALMPLCRLLFAETNPAPIKYAMAACGLCKNELRLPLSPIPAALAGAIDAELKKHM